MLVGVVSHVVYLTLYVESSGDVGQALVVYLQVRCLLYYMLFDL